MASLLSFGVVLALLDSLTQAYILNPPQPTPINHQLNPQGWTPRPTPSPRIPPELLRRATTSAAQYVLVAPDNTCGYISGSSGADFACFSTTASCVFYPGTGTSSYGSVGCCELNSASSSTCYVRNACVDYSSYYYSSACNDACRFDAKTLKCTDSSSRFCGSIRYPQATAQDYFCDTISGSSWMLASTTYIGETGRILSSSVIKLVSSSTSRITSSTSPSDTSQTTAVTTNQSESLGVTAKSAIQTGAIVGGVLGGLAVVGFFALAALFILKKYGKRPRNNSPLGTEVNDGVDGPSGPVEMAATWKIASPAQPNQIRHSNVFAYQTQYQPVVAEMPADEHA